MQDATGEVSDRGGWSGFLRFGLPRLRRGRDETDITGVSVEEVAVAFGVDVLDDDLAARVSCADDDPSGPHVAVAEVVDLVPDEEFDTVEIFHCRLLENFFPRILFLGSIMNIIILPRALCTL